MLPAAATFPLRTLSLFFFLAFFILLEVDAQSTEGGKETEDSERIEVRKLRFDEEGKPIEGSFLDSLKPRYYVDEAGKVFKYFRVYEKALAHYLNGYYPRKREDVEEGVVYIKGAPNVDKGFPESIETK